MSYANNLLQPSSDKLKKVLDAKENNNTKTLKENKENYHQKQKQNK